MNVSRTQESIQISINAEIFAKKTLSLTFQLKIHGQINLLHNKHVYAKQNAIE